MPSALDRKRQNIYGIETNGEFIMNLKCHTKKQENTPFSGRGSSSVDTETITWNFAELGRNAGGRKRGPFEALNYFEALSDGAEPRPLGALEP